MCHPPWHSEGFTPLHAHTDRSPDGIAVRKRLICGACMLDAVQTVRVHTFGLRAQGSCAAPDPYFGFRSVRLGPQPWTWRLPGVARVHAFTRATLRARGGNPVKRPRTAPADAGLRARSAGTGWQEETADSSRSTRIIGRRTGCGGFRPRAAGLPTGARDGVRGCVAEWCRAARIPGSRGFAAKGEPARATGSRPQDSPLPVARVTGDRARGEEWWMRGAREDSRCRPRSGRAGLPFDGGLPTRRRRVLAVRSGERKGGIRNDDPSLAPRHRGRAGRLMDAARTGTRTRTRTGGDSGSGDARPPLPLLLPPPSLCATTTPHRETGREPWPWWVSPYRPRARSSPSRTQDPPPAAS